MSKKISAQAFLLGHKYEILALLIYSLSVVLISLFHEPWRDEAQSWLLARDLNPISLLGQIGYEGHPILWHLTLFPFAKLGAPYGAMQAIHLLIAIIIAGLFLFCSPFSRVTRILFAFSYYMLFEYSVIARNYSLSVLILFLIAIFYPRRFRSPLVYSLLLILLLNANIHSFFIASPLILLYLWEFVKKKMNRWPAILALSLLAAGAAALVVLLSWHIERLDIRVLGKYFEPLSPLLAVQKMVFPGFYFILAGQILCILIALTIISLAFSKEPRALFIFYFSYAGMFYIFVFRRDAGLRHSGLLLGVLIFILWIVSPDKDKARLLPQTHKGKWLSRVNFQKVLITALTASFALSFICPSVSTYLKEYKYAFSGAKEMAQFLISSGHDKKIIVGHRSTNASALLPYLPEKKFWYADVEGYGTFIVRNARQVRDSYIPVSEALRRVVAAFGDRPDVFLLLSEPLDESQAKNYELIHKTGRKVFGSGGEIYYFYQPKKENH